MYCAMRSEREGVKIEINSVNHRRLETAGNALTRLCHGIALQSGWWSNPATADPIKRNTGEMLMLIVTEIAEAMEGHRKDLMDDKLPHRKMLEVELADAVIRIFDLAGSKGFCLGATIAEKLHYNLTRADHKPEARLAIGGKKC